MDAIQENIDRQRSELGEFLTLVQAMFVAVGSGRADVRYKLHSLVHSERLATLSWTSAVRKVNSAFTICGDMGTESRLGFCRVRLVDLFGNWILPQHDQAAPAAAEVTPPGPQPPTSPCAPPKDEDEDKVAELFGNFDDSDTPGNVGNSGGADDADPADAAVRSFKFAREDTQPPVSAVSAPAFSFQAEPGPVRDWILPSRASRPKSEAHDIDAQAEQDLNDLWVDLSHTLYIPGVLHIIHNAVKDLQHTLRHWDWFTTRLRHVCRLLSRKYSRQRLMETCFSAEPHCFFKNQYTDFTANVYEGRWGSVAFCIGQLLLVERSLRSAWSLDKYRFGRPDANQQRDGDSNSHIDLSIVDDALTSDEFWAFCHMFDMVGELTEMFMNFAESCPCHWSGGVFQGPQRHGAKHRNARRRRQRKHRCPLSGMRASELACGCVRELLRELWTFTNANLLLLPCVVALDNDARGRVLD